MPVGLASEEVVRPRSWEEAIDIRSQRPELRPICGGTDVMVEINFDRSRPAGLLDLTGVDELASWIKVDDGATLRVGAGVTYTRVVRELGEFCPALTIAARTVGSPQIRNRGTLGGNLATASPAGDSHPALLACRARVEVESTRGVRILDIDDFFVGPKRSALADDELIRAVFVPVATGPQQFTKIGPRNAMVIATASFAVSLDRDLGVVGTGIGSAGPTPLRALAAEQLLQDALEGRWRDPGPPDRRVLAEFGALVARAASPIDDVRGTARYRHHALSVIGSRCATWVWNDLSDWGS